MFLKCAVCGRSMRSAAVYFVGKPIGPTCARRADLTKLAARENNRQIKLCAPARRARDDGQAELFDGDVP